MFSFLRPYIFTLDPEAAHDLAIKSLKFNFMPKNFFQVENEEMLSTKLFKKKFLLNGSLNILVFNFYLLELIIFKNIFSILVY